MSNGDYKDYDGRDHDRWKTYHWLDEDEPEEEEIEAEEEADSE